MATKLSNMDKPNCALVKRVRRQISAGACQLSTAFYPRDRTAPTANFIDLHYADRPEAELAINKHARKVHGYRTPQRMFISALTISTKPLIQRTAPYSILHAAKPTKNVARCGKMESPANSILRQTRKHCNAFTSN